MIYVYFFNKLIYLIVLKSTSIFERNVDIKSVQPLQSFNDSHIANKSYVAFGDDFLSVNLWEKE
jgi:hypothetical protein